MLVVLTETTGNELIMFLLLLPVLYCGGYISARGRWMDGWARR